MFIHTVKYTFFSQIIVCQSFYGMSLTFSYFFFKGKFCVSAGVGKLLARCLLSKVPQILVAKMISPVVFDTNHSFKC